MSRRRRVAIELLSFVMIASFLTLGVGGHGVATTAKQGQPEPSTESVLLIGDSLMHQAARGITAALPGSSVVDASVPGTGLLNGSVDWFARTAQLLAEYHPDVVVVSFVGNYDRSQGSLVTDSTQFYDAWSAAAQRLTDLVRASGARVEWVAQPPLRYPNFYGVGAERTDELYVEYAALAREAHVGLIDADESIAGADGSYVESADVCGRTVTLRIGDGVHFTTVGADWWGAQLGRALARADGIATRDACAVVGDLDPAT
jgi:hypothetical protein